jgi:hypothetical protein
MPRGFYFNQLPGIDPTCQPVEIARTWQPKGNGASFFIKPATGYKRGWFRFI